MRREILRKRLEWRRGNGDWKTERMKRSRGNMAEEREIPETKNEKEKDRDKKMRHERRESEKYKGYKQSERGGRDKM